MNTVNNVANIIIAKNISRTANTTNGGGVTSATLASSCVADDSNIANGEVVVTNEVGYVLRPDTTGLTTLPKVYLVQGQGAGQPLLRSDAIYRSGVTSYQGTAFTQSTEQVSYYGYNPATALGSIEVINSNVYEAQALLQPISFMFGDKLNSVIVSYKSSSSATQSAIALGLSNQLILAVAYYPNRPFKIERVNDATTLTAFTSTSDAIKVTKGSTTVLFWLTDTNAASTGGITLGDVVNIPTSDGKTFTFTALTTIAHDVFLGTTKYAVADTSSGATANAAAIAAAINAGSQAKAFNVAAVVTVTPLNGVKFPPPVVWDTTGNAPIAVTIATGNTVPTKYINTTATAASGLASFELDQPYQGETGLIIDGTTMATNSGVATVITAWGLKMTGLPTQFRVGAKNYEKSRWANTLQNCGTTLVSNAQTVANEGVGNFEQVSYMEWFFQGFLGVISRIQVPPITLISNTEATGNYSVISLQFQEAQGTMILGNPASFKQIYIAGNKTGGYSSATTNQFAGTTDSSAGIIDTLDAWLNGLFPAQIANV